MPNDGMKVDFEALFVQIASIFDPRIKIFAEVFAKHGLSVKEGTDILIELTTRLQEANLLDSTEGGETE